MRFSYILSLIVTTNFTKTIIDYEYCYIQYLSDFMRQLFLPYFPIFVRIMNYDKMYFYIAGFSLKIFIENV